MFNLGTGKGLSVMEIIKTFEKATGQKVNYKIHPRRPGDISSVYADTSLANKELGWKADSQHRRNLVVSLELGKTYSK